MSIIFWDFDGTLVYSKSLWTGSVHKALKETDPNTPVTFEQLKICMSHGFTWHTPERDYSQMTGEKWWDFMNLHFYNSYLECGVPEDIALAAAGKIRGIIKQTENYHLFDDTLSTLQQMKAWGHTNVLLSNNYPDLDEVVTNLGLAEYFDGMIVSAVEGYDKPREELYNIAKKRFPGDDCRIYGDCCMGGDCYMVGDNVIADIGGGKRAGMKTILVHKGFSEDADYCFDHLSEICSLFAD